MESTVALLVALSLVGLVVVAPTASALRDPLVVCVRGPCGPQVPGPSEVVENTVDWLDRTIQETYCQHADC